MPGIELMERAGAGLAELVSQRAPEGRVAVVCGKGNNGGDGLVVARLLRDAGREVDVLLLGSPMNCVEMPGPISSGFPGRRRGASLPDRSTARRRSSTPSWEPGSVESRENRRVGRLRP